MLSIVRRFVACTPVLAALLAGCTRANVRTAADHEQQPHGLVVGQRLAQRPLDCGRAGTIVFADTAASQLVTFATETDCSRCHAHMAGLDAMVDDDSIRVQEFIFLWAPRADLQRAAMFARARTPRPVCIDTASDAWASHAVEHTPVTALIDHGRIRYLHDFPLASAWSQQRLLEDLRFYSARSP